MAYDPLEYHEPSTPDTPAPAGDMVPPGYDPQEVRASRKITDTSFHKVPSRENGEGGFWDNASHAFGVGVRDVVQGAVGGAADLATAPGRLLQRGIHALVPSAWTAPGTPPSQLIDQAVAATGAPQAVYA